MEPNNTTPTEEQMTMKERREIKRQEKLEKRSDIEKKADREKRYRVLLWLFVIVVLVGVIFAMAKLAAAPTADQSTGDLTTTIMSSIVPTDHMTDNLTATTTLIEYGDFQCPACEAFYPIVQQVTKDFGGKIRFIFRNFPLSQHPNARPAAMAAEAAANQGKFWDMYNLLYGNQSDWANLTDPLPVFLKYATSLKLNIPEFTKDSAATSTATAVQNSYDEGVKYNVEWTPTFFINNTRISQPTSLADFEQDIQDAINGTKQY